MKKIFIESYNNKTGDFVFIKGDDYYHLVKVYRVKIGEKFIIGDKYNNEYSGKVYKIEKDKLSIILEENIERKKEKKIFITLFFSILKGDKNEIIIQKCTEIGIDKFVPVKTKNSILQINNKENKIIRWKKIARETAMQSGREKIPEINDIILFENIFNYSYNINEKKIFGHILEEKEKNLFNFRNDNKDLNFISLFIGPEGDFDKNELILLKKNGWEGVNLSPYILKSETAAIFFSSIIFYYYNKQLLI